MLTQYQTDTQALLQLPGASVPLYPLTNVTRWINIARGQIAGEGECIRVMGSISTVVGQRNYNFSDINIGVPVTTGVQGAIHVSSISYAVASGALWVPSRPWPWYSLYAHNNAVPVPGPPAFWAQFGQGSAGTGQGTAGGGSFYIDPPPDLVYTLSLNCVCYPIALVDDTTVESLPYLWTDAVPFFAAYYALLSSQTAARQADAARYFEMYEQFQERARKASNPSVQRWQFRQAGDPAQAAKMGLQPNKAGG